MATSQLQLYNIGLNFIGERKLDSLTENRETRRLLDAVWSEGDGAVKYFLEEGYWNFAMRAVRLDSSPSITPQFGWSYGFEKPSDWVRLNQISSDERFMEPLHLYELEGGNIFCDVDPLYLRYVSDSPDYGSDFSLWPHTFTLWAGGYLGYRIAPNLKNDLDMERLEERLRKRLVNARSKDAQQEPPRWAPLSSWARSRLGRHGRRDRGLRNQLIGR